MLFELTYRNNSIWWKVLFAINSFIHGIISVIFGNFRYTGEWSARTAYKNFKGINEESIKNLVSLNTNGKYLINLNSKFIDAILEIRKIKKIPDEELIEVSIHSQGTCKKMIELFIDRDDIKNSFFAMRIKVSKIYANQLETYNGKLTGNIIGQVVTKYNKMDNIPEGCIFIGDNYDEKAIIKSGKCDFEFINVNKISRIARI